MAEDRRDELQRWIAQTRSNQRKLGVIVVAGGLLGLLLLPWRGDVGGIVLGSFAILAAGGFWITFSHLQDFRAKLEALDRSPPR